MTERDVDKFIADALYAGPSVDADQLIGVESCLHQLAGQLALIARPELAKRFGLEPSGTLFLGRPGTGKTLLARYLASHLSLPMYQFAADEFGSDPALIHEVFRRLAGQRVVVFLDEVSILAQRRDWSDADDRRMLSALLTSLDGLAGDPSSRPWVIGACTPDIQLDPAIYRSGRLGVVVEFAPPSEEQRRQLFRLYLAPVPHAVSDHDISRFAEMSPHATGADIHDWVNQAASEVLAEQTSDDPTIEYRHIEKVVARHGFVGADDRPGRQPTLEICTHEASHAVLAWSLFGPDSLSNVAVGFGRARTNFPGLSLGHFELSNDWLAENPPNSGTWPDHAVVSLAGLCAEQVLLGYRGAGGESDVHDATRIIVHQLDTGDADFGPSRTAMEYAGHEKPTGSQDMRSNAWHIARPRYDACFSRTLGLVAEHRGHIGRLASVLLEARTTLSGEEIVAIIANGS